MGRRVKELEQAVARKDGEIAQLRQRMDELGVVLEKYRLQESAIAGALTRAQTAAEKIVREAQDEKEAILRKAKEDKLEAETEAKGIVADAERHAAIIEGDAKEKARLTATRAEAFMADYRSSAGNLIAQFRRTASEASSQANVFADFMNGLNLDEALEITGEYEHLSALSQMPAQDMPDDYVDSASLMRSIYAIEQRDLPERQAEIEKNPVPETEKEPLPEIERETVPEIVPLSTPEYEPIPAPEPGKTLDTEQQASRVTDPFTSWVRPEEKTLLEKDAVDLDIRDENDHVWTVEEIVERTNANGNTQIDDELNAIIEDVLRGS